MSNNGIACINSQSTIAQSGNSRVSACTYTVTWNANGGSLAGSSSTSWTYGTSLRLPAAPTQTGYTFNGWFTAPSGGSNVGTAGGSYTPTNTANFTIWAQWSQTGTPINFVYWGEASSNGNAYGNLCSSGQTNPCYVLIHDYNGHLASFNNAYGPNANITDAFAFAWSTAGQIYIEVGTVGGTYTPCRIDLWSSGPSPADIYNGTSNSGNHLAGIDFIAAGNSVWFPSNIFNPGQTVYWTTSTNCQP